MFSEWNEDTKFVYKNVGYGLTSYEEGNDFHEIRDGKLITETFDSEGMTWDEAESCWKFDGGLGMITYAILRDEDDDEQNAGLNE